MKGNVTFVSLDELMLPKKIGLDPKNFPDEEFDYYTVPSHASGTPDWTKGIDIGSRKYLLEENDVLLSRINPHLNRVWVVKPSDRRKIGSSEWVIFRCSDRVVPEYLAHYLSRQVFVDYCKSNVSGVGGSLTRTKVKAIEDYNIPIVDKEHQKSIAASLEKSLKEINKLIEIKKTQIEILPELYQSILESTYSFDGEE